MSGAITQKISRGGNPKIGGAQQLMLGNNPVKFEDPRSHGSRVRCAAKLVIIYIKCQ